MKILLISPLPPPAGGIASWTKRYLESPQARENEVFMVNTAVEGSRVSQFNNIRIMDEIKRTVNILKSLVKQIRENNPEIVHLNTPCSKLGIMRDYLCGIIVKNSKTKLIIHCRCDVSHMINSKLGEFFFKRLVRLADRVITLNKKSRNFILDKCGKDSDIIANFISNDVIINLRNEYEISNTVTNVIYVGHITKLKGCEIILKVAKHFPNIKFMLVGYISAEIALLNKPDNIVFTGELSKEQVIDKMKKSDLFLFPTYTEGFPNAVMEAMACGLPVVSTDVGAIPDMIENKGGILVSTGDVEGFIDAVTKLQNDKNLRVKISEWNRNKVLNYYTEQHVMDILFEKYKKTIVDRN